MRLSMCKVIHQSNKWLEWVESKAFSFFSASAMSIVLKKSTTQNDCFIDGTTAIDVTRGYMKTKSERHHQSCSLLSRRLFHLNYNLESVRRVAGATAGAIRNKILWKKRSVNLTEYDPEYKVMYLGNVLTPWAKGTEAIEKPLCILWKNYCVNVRNQIVMKLRIHNSSLNAVTTQHGLTEYTWSRITFCETNNKFPKVLAWVFRHPSKKFKHELRCHAVLFSKEEEAVAARNHILSKLSTALAEFKREKRMQANSRHFISKAYECHQLFCSQPQIKPFHEQFDQVDTHRTGEKNATCNNAPHLSESFVTGTRFTDSTAAAAAATASGDSSDTCSSLSPCNQLQHATGTDPLFSSSASSDSYDETCSRDMTKCLISARSSTSSSSSRTSSTSSCSCSDGSTSASLCRCKRSARKNQSTCTLNYSGVNCTGRLYSQYTGKSGASFIPVRKKHLVRGQVNFRPSLERSKSAPRLTCIDEEDDETSCTEFDVSSTVTSSSSSSSSSSSDSSDEDEVNECADHLLHHPQRAESLCEKSELKDHFINDHTLSDLLLTVDIHDDKGQALLLAQSLSSSPSPNAACNKPPCYQYILETIWSVIYVHSFSSYHYFVTIFTCKAAYLQ